MRFLHRNIYFLSALIILFTGACKYKKPDRKNVSFKNIIGIDYTEVKRRLSTGRSFDNRGYEVGPDPEWRITFISKDSTRIFSPDSNRFLTFPLMLDHDSIFNTGNTWLKAKIVTKDSLLFQVIRVESNIIYWMHSNVYMKFYANDYIKNHHLDITKLQGKDRNDTLFVKQRAALCNAHPDSVFAARNPVQMKSKSPFVTVEKEVVERTRENHWDTSDSYMEPKYDITIHHAYQDFSYSFTAFVDVKGNITYEKSLIYISDEFKASTERTIKGIIDGYIKAYITVTPGSTLGIVHSSRITINVNGFKK